MNEDKNILVYVLDDNYWKPYKKSIEPDNINESKLSCYLNSLDNYKAKLIPIKTKRIRKRKHKTIKNFL